MALPLDNRQVNNVVTTTLDMRRKEVIDGFFTKNPIMLQLYKKHKVVTKGGDFITTNFVYGQVEGGSYGRGDPFSPSVTEFMTQMRHEWKMNYGAMNWHGLDVAKNQGVHAVVDYTDAVLKNARLRLEKSVAQQIHGSGGGNNMDGFGNAVSTTATYGGIARDGSAQGTAITPTVNTTGGPFSLTMVNQSMGDAAILGDDAIDLIVSNQTIFNKVWERSQPSERNSAGGMRSIGWKGNTVQFNGAEWVVDPYCPSGTIELWNTNYWDFVILAGRDFKVRGPFDLHLQDASVGQLILTANLVCKGPKFQSIITNVT